MTAPGGPGVIGAVRAGTGITITAEGVISTDGSGGGSATSVVVTPIPGISQATTVQAALQAIETQVQDRIEYCDVEGPGGLLASVSAPVATSADGTTLTLTTVQATTTQHGVVQLTNDLTGSSQTLVPTQSAVASLDGKIDALVGASVLAGTYSAAVGQVLSVTPAGAQYMTVGQQAPLASSVPDNYFLLVTVAGSQGPPGAVIPPTGMQSGDWFIVEREQGLPSVWFTVDFENNAVAAVNVTLSNITGLSATNVQTGIEQVNTKAQNAFTTIEAPTADGIRVVASGSSATGRTADIFLDPATSTDLGGVFVQGGQGLVLGANGSLSVPPATATVLGGVKVGTGISVTADGTISVSGQGSNVTKIIAGQNVTISPLDGTGIVTINSTASGGGGEATDVILTPIPGIDSASNVQSALQLIELQVQDRIEFCDVVGGGITASVSSPVTSSADGTTLTLTTLTASPTQKGLVTLTNDINGNSINLAPTQLAVSALNDKVDALTGSNVLAGTYNSSTGVVTSVTPAGSQYFTVGQQAPPAANVPDNYFLLVTVAGVLGPPGAVIPSTGIQSGDWFIVEKEPGTNAVWFTIDFENSAVAAINVSLAAVPGLSATNVQEGIQQLETNYQGSITNIEAVAADGISVTLSPASATGRTANITLGPATQTDLGGVFVSGAKGIGLAGSGDLSIDLVALPSLP